MIFRFMIRGTTDLLFVFVFFVLPAKSVTHVNRAFERDFFFAFDSLLHFFFFFLPLMSATVRFNIPLFSLLSFKHHVPLRGCIRGDESFRCVAWHSSILLWLFTSRFSGISSSKEQGWGSLESFFVRGFFLLSTLFYLVANE